MFAYKIIVNGHNVPFRKGVDMTIDRMIALMDAVIASKKEYKIFDKKSFGSFSLVGELESFKDTIEEITIVGLCTDICVVSNALMLRSMLNNTPIYYVEDATAGVSKESKQAALITMNACQIYKKGK